MKHILGALFVASAGATVAQDATVPAKDQATAEKKATGPTAPVIKKIDALNYKVGNVSLNKKTREITFTGRVESPEDVVEFLITTQHGKIHETLFVTDIRPMSLNLALILLKYKGSKELFRVLDKDYRPTDKFHQETDATKAAARFDIFVSWSKDGKKITHHANDLIRNSSTKKSAVIRPYVFGGSYALNGRFKADLTGDIVGIYTDRGAIANFSNLGHEDDSLWFPYKERLPAKGTTVTFTIKKHIAAKK